MPKIAVPVQSAVGESAKPIAHRESVAPTKPILNSWMLVKCRDRMKPENLVIVNGTSAPSLRSQLFRARQQSGNDARTVAGREECSVLLLPLVAVSRALPRFAIHLCAKASLEILHC